MAKRIDKSRVELEELGFRPRREDEFIERLVLPSDTLQGIALIYNTSVAELKKLNHILSEAELHARRVIKVPSKGILVDLFEAPAKSSPQIDISRSNISRSNVSLDVLSDDSGENDLDNNGQVYLNNVDSVIKEIKEKAQISAARSPILNGSESPLLSQFAKKQGEVKWWLILLPCLAVLIGFPVLYFLYRERIEEHHPLNSTETKVS